MKLLKRVFLGLLVIIVLLVVIAFVLPRQVAVERSRVIDAAPETVFAALNGFHRFNEWSPWADRDPNATYAYEGPITGVGARMTWSGDPKTVGAGSQEIVASEPHERVAANLDFGEQGTAESEFRLEPAEEGTRVTWGFRTDLGNNPIARYMGLMFDSWIGKDYEEGLAALDAFVGALPEADLSGLEVEAVTVAPMTVAFVTKQSGQEPDEIAKAIESGIGEVMRFVGKRKLEATGPPITINQQWEGGQYVFDAAVPVVAGQGVEVPSDSAVSIKSTWEGPALKVVHRGSYQRMNATYEAAFAYVEAAGYEPAGPPWDVYVTDPTTTPEDELVTEIYIPVEAI